MRIRTAAKILTKLYKNTPAVANNGKLYVCKTTGNGRAAEFEGGAENVRLNVSTEFGGQRKTEFERRSKLTVRSSFLRKVCLSLSNEFFLQSAEFRLSASISTHHKECGYALMSGNSSYIHSAAFLLRLNLFRF